MRRSSSPRFSRVVRYSLGGTILFTSGVALAVITQPNGAVVPANGGGALEMYLNGSNDNDNINEGIDAVLDAAVEPETYFPLCTEFTGKYIAKGGSANFAIGWYNVDDSAPSDDPPKYVPIDKFAGLNTAAPESDIQILFPFSSSLPPPQARYLTSESLRTHPAYKGGRVGFVLIPNPNGTGAANATQYHYTEHRFNVQCALCEAPGPWYSALTYQSKQVEDTLYLGFEDLDFKNAPGNQGVNGNDLDYEDFLFRFSGIACSAAGSPCDVPGGVGACAKGISECDAQGAFTCEAVVEPGSLLEVCDAIDNDCNDLVDDEATCPDDEICHHGSCVAPCDPDVSPCPFGQECQGQVCVEDACVEVVCAVGEVCAEGACRVPCTGVVCPLGQICSGDQCLDPCGDVVCAPDSVCADGVCVASCACRSCGDSESCDANSGQCVETPCLGVACDPGAVCVAGACIDACEGVVCPPHSSCASGQCIADVPPDEPSTTTGGDETSTGAGDGTSTGAADTDDPTTGATGTGGPVPTSSASASDSSSSDPSQPSDPTRDPSSTSGNTDTTADASDGSQGTSGSGCGCREAPSSPWMLLGLVAALGKRRRAAASMPG